MKKRWIIISILLLTIILFTGCDDSKKNIAVLLYDQEDPFIKGIGERLIEYNNTDYNITIYDCKKSQIVQNEIAEQLYEDNIDLLIINPVDRLSSYIFVQKSLKEDVPLIFFNREPLKEDLKPMKEAYYVGANAMESGRMQADMIAEAFGNNPDNLNKFDKNNDNIIQCIILKGEQGHQDAEERTTAVIEELENKGFKIEVLLTKITNWNEDEAYRNMNEIMGIYEDDIELLISNNDAMAIGAAKYLKDHNYYGKEINGIVTEVPFIIVGVDGIDEAIEYIEKGYMYGTIINDSSNIAKAMLELSKYILDENVNKLSYELVDEKYIWIPYKNFSFE